MENLENQMSGGGYSVNLIGENVGNRQFIQDILILILQLLI